MSGQRTILVGWWPGPSFGTGNSHYQRRIAACYCIQVGKGTVGGDVSKCLAIVEMVSEGKDAVAVRLCLCDVKEHGNLPSLLSGRLHDWHILRPFSYLQVLFFDVMGRPHSNPSNLRHGFATCPINQPTAPVSCLFGVICSDWAAHTPYQSRLLLLSRSG